MLQYEYECAGERYVDIVGVTVRKYAYEYGTSRMRNIKRFFVGTYGTRTGSGPHGLLTVNIPAWVRMVRDTRDFFFRLRVRVRLAMCSRLTRRNPQIV